MKKEEERNPDSLTTRGAYVHAVPNLILAMPTCPPCQLYLDS